MKNSCLYYVNSVYCLVCLWRTPVYNVYCLVCLWRTPVYTVYCLVCLWRTPVYTAYFLVSLWRTPLYINWKILNLWKSHNSLRTVYRFIFIVMADIFLPNTYRVYMGRIQWKGLLWRHTPPPGELWKFFVFELFRSDAPASSRSLLKRVLGFQVNVTMFQYEGSNTKRNF